MPQIFIQHHNPRESDLIIRSDNLKMLNELKETIEDLFTRCDVCKGEVTRSSGMYLCLSGCGHVKGEPRTQSAIRNDSNVK